MKDGICASGVRAGLDMTAVGWVPLLSVPAAVQPHLVHRAGTVPRLRPGLPHPPAIAAFPFL